MKITNDGNATRLLAILREGWRDGQANRNLLAECRRRYGDDEPAHKAYMAGYCSGVEFDTYAMDVVKIDIIHGDYMADAQQDSEPDYDGPAHPEAGRGSPDL